VDDSLTRLVAGWRAAEQRLYPIIMARPEMSERCLGLVRAIADDLGEADTVPALGRRSEAGASIVDGAAERTGITTEGLDLDLVAGAAFCLRYREILAQTGKRDARRRIEEARARGEPWALVYETDPRGDAPYRRLELHLPSGAGVHAFVELDDETGAPTYRLEALPLDARTGERVEDLPPIAPRRTFEDRGEWQAAVDALRARLEDPHRSG